MIWIFDFEEGRGIENWGISYFGKKCGIFLVFLWGVIIIKSDTKGVVGMSNMEGYQVRFEY